MKKFFILCFALVFCGPAVSAPKAADYAFQNPDVPLEERVADLVSRLTLEEKVTLMNEEAAALPRLGIKKYRYWNEALHGVARAGKFTVFPQAIGLAATWDPALIFEVATAISDEAWGANNRDALTSGYPPERFLTFWSPVVNMARDPRWGRTPESYGEDPVLTTQIALAFVAGLQGSDPRYLKTASTPKHFAANNQEASRLYGNSVVSEKTLREYYFPAFRATVEQGRAASIMGAYNALNGIPCNANKWLLTDVLRREWGFDGFVVTDCGAPSFMISQHQYAKDGAEAAAYAVNAGVDIECGGENILPEHLIEAVRRGLTTEAVVDQAVARLVRSRMRLGMFDPPGMNPYTKISPEVIGSPAHNALARRASRESIVLLKNDKAAGAPLLPLDPARVQSVAVAGPHADNLEYGDYSGEPANPPVTLLSGLQARAGEGVHVRRAPWTPIPREGYRPVPAAMYKTGDGAPGVTAAFYDNPQFSGQPAVTRVDTGINYTASAVPEAVAAGPYAVRWSGALVPAYAGAHVFNITARGSVRLLINGEQALAFEDTKKPGKQKFQSGQVIREDMAQKQPPNLHLAVVFAAPDRPLDFVLEYVPLKKNPVLRLEWDARGHRGPRRRVPGCAQQRCGCGGPWLHRRRRARKHGPHGSWLAPGPVRVCPGSAPCQPRRDCHPDQRQPAFHQRRGRGRACDPRVVAAR